MPWMEPGSRLFILDFSYPRETILELQRTHESVILLDHHKTAAEELQGVPHCHIDQSHSGAYLAWQYANPSEKPPGLILYVQDRDLWEWKLPNSREVSEAIASYPNTFAAWDSFDVGALAREGTGILRYMRAQVNKLVSMASRQTVGGRPDIPVVNTSLMVSEACEALLKKFPRRPVRRRLLPDGRRDTLESQEPEHGGHRRLPDRQRVPWGRAQECSRLRRENLTHPG